MRLRALVIGLIGFALASASAGGALASGLADDTGQLVNISHQVTDMQKKLDELRDKGRVAKIGKLAAAADCGLGEASQVFMPWGDSASYRLIPQGDVSDTSGWSLKNVSVASEDDPATPGSSSLLFTKGDSEAVTPVTCVTADDPTLRLFLADRGGNGRATIEVKVIYDDLDGATHDLTLARLRVTDQWQPSVVIPIGVNLLSAGSANGWTPVAFRFKVHGLGKGETFSLKGVYVDPWCGR
jgi:hypothetical protein